jgi:hypothetical protein
MDSDKVRMMQLARKGYYCGQILVIMGLEAKGDYNPELVRAVDGLSGGCTEGSCTCGALTGGCCLLSLFAGKGNDKETRDENYHRMLTELVRWFWATYGFKYKGIDCMAIIDEAKLDQAKHRCWDIMGSVYSKVVNILESNGIEMNPTTCYAR